jgi:hypothetical protein
MTVGEEEYIGPDRRTDDRRQEEQDPSEAERRSGLERRRGPGRRRGDDRRAAEEGEITDEVLEFVMAIDEYKRLNSKPFPSWTEVFEIIQYLGYRKVAEKSEHIDRRTEAELVSASPT